MTTINNVFWSYPRVFLLTSFLALAPRMSAQVSISGIYDFEVKKGGAQSTPGTNKLNNGNIQFNIHGLHLFLEGEISPDISFSGKIAATKRGGEDAAIVSLELAHVTFSNVVGEIVNISAGKILTPFGAYSRRQLSPDNPLIGTPLFFYYLTNVSPSFGYLNSATLPLAQASYGGQLSTIYYGGYYSGVEVFGSIAGNLFSYDVAVMNAPLSSTHSGINLDKQVGIHGRVAVQPAIWGTAGVSYAGGSFLESGPVNQSMGSLDEFKQQTVGLDLNLNYLYYEFNAEYILNEFQSPYIVYNLSPPPFYVSGLAGRSMRLSSREILIDLKIDAPFYAGLYIAGRYNAVMFGSITDPFSSSPTFGSSIPWDRDVQRFEFTVGYKPARGVIVKVGYQTTKVDVAPRPDLDVLGSQVSISF